MKGSLQDKVAVVTGAAQGIGNTIARRFANEGAKVVIADMNRELGAAALQELERERKDADFCLTDISDPVSVQQLIGSTLDRFKRIDILVNNAGFAIIGPSADYRLEDWKKTIDVMQTGVFLCSQAAGREMIKQESGNIINIASINGLVAIPGRLAYSAAKGAILMMTKVLAVEWAEHNIRVNAICPGPTSTEGREANAAKGIVDNESVKKRIPMRRIAQRDEIADCAIFLASEQSSYITGERILVDGGWVSNGSYF